MLQEHVILLDKDGVASGTQEKYAAHHAETPLHLAFSSWLFNARGECLLTRRSLHKKAWPGVWTNSVCGHPQSGEDFTAAVIRRCQFEVGATVDAIAPVYPEFRYCETDPSGIVENEICPVFAARVTTPLAVNADEVMDYQWVTLEALFCAVDATPWAFSPWMVQQVARPEVRERLRVFAAA